MPKFPKIITAMIVTIISLLVGLSSSAAQETRLLSAQPSLPAASAHGAARTHANSSARAATPKQFELARIAPSSAAKKEHRLILQVNTSDSASMNLALNNALNVAQYYKEVGEEVKVEVITFGPGLHMLRDDTSPVKARIEEMALSTPEVSFKACGNTQEKMQKAENKDIPIVAQAQVVRSGVVRVMQLQEQGWTYVKP
jgi:intracellular sulfur oxidation DsrE/DsrF family protein